MQQAQARLRCNAVNKTLAMTHFSILIVSPKNASGRDCFTQPGCICAQDLPDVRISKLPWARYREILILAVVFAAGVGISLCRPAGASVQIPGLNQMATFGATVSGDWLRVAVPRVRSAMRLAGLQAGRISRRVVSITLCSSGGFMAGVSGSE